MWPREVRELCDSTSALSEDKDATADGTRVNPQLLALSTTNLRTLDKLPPASEPAM